MTFDERVARWADRFMGLAPTLGELNGEHLHMVIAFTVDTASDEPSEVIGVLFDITHEARGGTTPEVPLRCVTTVRVRTQKRFETFTLPGEQRCHMETPYKKSVRTSGHE